jgi:hypothetical protein
VVVLVAVSAMELDRMRLWSLGRTFLEMCLQACALQNLHDSAYFVITNDNDDDDDVTLVATWKAGQPRYQPRQACTMEQGKAKRNATGLFLLRAGTMLPLPAHSGLFLSGFH